MGGPIGFQLASPADVTRGSKSPRLRVGVLITSTLAHLIRTSEPNGSRVLRDATADRLPILCPQEMNSCPTFTFLLPPRTSRWKEMRFWRKR